MYPRKSLSYMIILIVLLSSSSAYADFYVIGTGRKVGIEIRSLPYTITSPGFYYITKELTSTDSGITVNVDHVTIDLMGFSVIGPGSGTNYGIYMNARSNVEIRNGTVRNFGSHGVYEQSQQTGKNHRVINVRAVENKGSGILLYGDSYQVKDCTASDNDEDGIFAGKWSKVTGNTAQNNGSDGIYGNGGNLVQGNVCKNNGENGIVAVAGSTIKDNIAILNKGVGIAAASGCTVTGNTASSNTMGGLDIASTYWAGSTVTDNTAYSNGGDGIAVGNSTVVIRNTSFYNDNYGISLSHQSLVDRNLAYSNNRSGGSYTNMSTCSGCVFGTNLAP